MFKKYTYHAVTRLCGKSRQHCALHAGSSLEQRLCQHCRVYISGLEEDKLKHMKAQPQLSNYELINSIS